MYQIAKLKPEDRAVLFNSYAIQAGLSPVVVEKDFWVTLVLDYLFHHSKFAASFTFKGGTSLSKCFHIIDRFSEDIDLILDWKTLGFPADEPYQNRSHTAQLKYNQEVEDTATKFIASQILPDLEKGFADILREAPRFQLGEGDGHIINFYYPSTFNIQSAGILPCVRLEIGPLAEATPSVEKEISPLICGMNIPFVQTTSTRVRAISPERTFWEKVLILHQEANRPEWKLVDGVERYNPIPRRYARHYYDVWKISLTDYKRKAMDNIDLLRQVIAFKNKFYRYSWNRLDECVPGSIRLVPPSFRMAELRKDFESMKEMIHDDSVKNFDDLMGHLSALEKELNKHSAD